ncbi:hypothetical protein pdam_00007021 [Pocillopora damicornis]|uniref:Uncharacterized protein n=1 Tax=Pocillopora damicornis TaxID=46731 RepID=A0A3M6T8Z8_POCDA|nr:hypothetical protein pdam_00007021 [Pocillopora damicornis]
MPSKASKLGQPLTDYSLMLLTVTNARILGLAVSNNLKGNDHVVNIIKKANKRLHFIVQFKRTKVPEQDIITFYVTCVGPVLEYSCQVFHFARPAYLSDTIEWVQKRVLAIIYPDSDYADSLDLRGILKLNNRRLKACDILKFTRQPGGQSDIV